MWHKTIAGTLRQVGIGLLAASLAFGSALGQSSLLPDGKQQFLSNTGVPLASGKVFMYVPNTTTFKNTWQDAAQMTLNTNPVILDSSGRALIYGSGIYRQLVQTSAGVTIYDALTTSTLTQTDIGYFIGNATSTGTANAQIIAATTPSTFALTTGFTISFKPGFTNTGQMNLNVNGTGIKPVVKPAYTGQAVLTGGEVVANSMTAVVYDGANYMLQSMPDGFGVSTAINSATTTDLGTIASHNVGVSGTTTITSFGSSASVNYPFYFLRFAGALTITYNASTMLLPGAANITTAAGDTAIAQYFGSGVWVVTQYQKAAVPPYSGASPTVQVKTVGSGTYTPTSTSLRYAKVTMAGGGGGGGASATNAGNNGTASTFTPNAGSVWTADFGRGGAVASGTRQGGAGGSGGSAGTGTLISGVSGQAGGDGTTTGESTGSVGGSSSCVVGGGLPTRRSDTGHNATANSGGGGGGGYNQATNGSGGGGGGAQCQIFFITAAQINGSAAYVVGAKGTGGAAGTNAGGDGADGFMIIEEYYKFLRSVCSEPTNDNYDFEICKAM